MSIKIDDHNDLRTCNRFRSTSIDFYGHQHALRKAEDRKRKNFRVTPYINHAFCVINYVSALLSSKTMVNSPEYFIYTSVINTYCVNKRGFQFLSFFFIFFYPSLSLFSPLMHLPLSPVPPGFLFPFFSQ